MFVKFLFGGRILFRFLRVKHCHHIFSCFRMCCCVSLCTKSRDYRWCVELTQFGIFCWHAPPPHMNSLSYQFHTKTLSQKGSKHWRWSRCSPPQQVTRHVQVSTSVVSPCWLMWPAFCSAAKVKRTFSDEVVVLPDKDLLMMSATVCPTLSTWLSQYYNRTETKIANDRIDCRPRATLWCLWSSSLADIFFSASFASNIVITSSAALECAVVSHFARNLGITGDVLSLLNLEYSADMHSIWWHCRSWKKHSSTSPHMNSLSYQFHSKTLSQKGSKHWRWSRCSPPQQVTRHVQVSPSVVPPCWLTWPAFCSAAEVKRTFSDEVVVLPDKDLLMMSATVCPTSSTWLSQYYNRIQTNIIYCSSR